MIKLTIGVATAALCLGWQVARAQDPSDHEPKTQGQILKEQSQACEGLRGAELKDCMANYVGPAKDANIDSAEKASAGVAGASGSDAKQKDSAKDDSGSADVDMKNSEKRGPVGPMKNSPDKQKQ